MSEGTQKLELSVEGMNCSHCSGSVLRAVSELDGVTDCQVYLDDGRAVVHGRDLETSAVIGVIEGLGFKAHLQPE